MLNFVTTYVRPILKYDGLQLLPLTLQLLKVFKEFSQIKSPAAPSCRIPIASLI